MGLQATWSKTITQRVAGMAVDGHTQAYAVVATGKNEKATAIFPGRFVVKGTSDTDVKIQDSGASGGLYIGLAVDNENRERVQGSLATEGYLQYKDLPVAKTGIWYVETEEAVAKGGTVYVRYVAGAGGSVIGLARTDVDTASAEAIKAKFAETTTAAGLAAVELNIPQV